MDTLAKRGAMGIFIKHMCTRTSLPAAEVEARARKQIGSMDLEANRPDCFLTVFGYPSAVECCQRRSPPDAAI